MQGRSGSRALQHGAKAMDGAKSLNVQHLWTRRRSGSGTITQSIAEQERSVSAPAFSWHRAATPMCPVTANPISAAREVGERRAEVGGGVVAVIGVDNTTRRSEGPPARCASNPVKAKAEEPMRALGPVVNVVAWRNAAGRRPGGKPCEGEPHARFGEGVLETTRRGHGGECRGWVGNRRPVRYSPTTAYQRAPRQGPTPPLAEDRRGER